MTLLCVCLRHQSKNYSASRASVTLDISFDNTNRNRYKQILKFEKCHCQQRTLFQARNVFSPWVYLLHIRFINAWLFAFRKCVIGLGAAKAAWIYVAFLCRRKKLPDVPLCYIPFQLGENVYPGNLSPATISHTNTITFFAKPL